MAIEPLYDNRWYVGYVDNGRRTSDVMVAVSRSEAEAAFHDEHPHKVIVELKPYSRELEEISQNRDRMYADADRAAICKLLDRAETVLKRCPSHQQYAVMPDVRRLRRSVERYIT